MDVKITGIADVSRILAEIAPKEAKNLMRATTADLAKGIAADAKTFAPTDVGDLRKSIGHKRARGDRETVKAEVIANKGGGAFYWRFLEYGDGPDGVEHAFFLKALRKAETELPQRYLEAFTDKLVKRLARLAKSRG